MEENSHIPKSSTEESTHKKSLDLSSILKDDIFTFIVGEEQERFHVHISAVKRISEPLGIMMTNGKMQESVKKEAVLSDTDPATFGYLLEYAYQGLCGILQGHTKPVTKPFFPTKFRCHGCSLAQSFTSRTQAAMSQYPFCSPICRFANLESQEHVLTCVYPDHASIICSGGARLHKAYCVVDGSKFTRGLRNKSQIHCTFCIGDNRTEGYPSFADEEIESTKVNTGCSSRFSSKRFGCSEMGHIEMRDHIQKHTFKGSDNELYNAQLLANAKLYVLASKYLVTDLPNICLHKLHAQLLAFEINKDSIATLTRLLSYVYENTSCEGSISNGTGDKLRDLVIRYVVDRAEDIMQYEEARYEIMVRAEGAPGVDFLAVMYGKTTA